MEIKMSTSCWDILYKSERSGHLAWSNQPAPGEVDALQEFFHRAGPDVVVELGTRFAGTTLAIHDACPQATIFSIDVANSTEDRDVICANREAHLLTNAHVEYNKHIALRSWFPEHVRFLKMDFLGEASDVKAIVDRHRLTEGTRLVVFVDGYDKLAETAAYQDWLVPGDIMAVNNWLDGCGGAEQVEAVMDMDVYRRYLWEWSEKHLVFTRFWRRV